MPARLTQFPHGVKRLGGYLEHRRGFPYKNLAFMEKGPSAAADGPEELRGALQLEGC
jgi:hypothetical protein